MHEKVNRIMKITGDFFSPEHRFKILDLACGSGLYSITASNIFKNAKIDAIDVRSERMVNNKNVTFYKRDIRDVSNGLYDIIYMLGILYHLDFPDSLNVLKNLRKMSNILIIDTHISLSSKDVVGGFCGKRYREHPLNSTLEQKQKNLKASIDNEWSFWYDKSSLLKALTSVGYTTIYEVLVPFEPNKPKDRITIVARC